MVKGQAVPITIIIVGIAVIISMFFLFNSDSFTTGGVISNPEQENQKENCREEQIPYEEQEEYMKTEYYAETVPYTDTECEAKELIYKKDTGTCKQKVDNFFAVDEPAQYDCTITNLDTEGGTFYLNIGFNVEGQQLEETQNDYIYPQSSNKFTVSRDATIDSCYCSEINLPTKQVCRDITKYKEVQKSREVTAYRPVTKYRTETVCN